ncbi:alpha/beta fold hydrolase [uncultured Desulfuromonas sp.]|uniref:alpha/beta fold hydrolase n=1 Tax=uncultured Desulfuromonas sp. TaxID=181013 RepID=UPI002AABECEA|nr:alpha/beta fold hydrolase [uncultured Desulfuromonas sp.]
MILSTGTFETFDKSLIFYRKWAPETKGNGRIMLLLHRGHEHSERLDGIANNPVFADYTIYSYDYRGHGYTETPATYEFMTLVRDLDAFARFVCKTEGKGMDDIFVTANSVAGVVASTWVHDYAPMIKGMALIAPAFHIKLYAPFAKQFLELAIRFKPEMNIKSYVKARYLTHDVTEQRRYNEDPLVTPNIPARQLTTLLNAGRRVVADAAAIAVPTLILSAGSDYVVDSKVQGDFYAGLSSPLKRFVPLEGFYHGMLYEQEAQKVVDEVGAFMETCFSANTAASLDEMVRWTQNECDRIAFGSLPPLRSLNFRLQRLSMKRLGFISEGISIGLRYGFDSGVTLDHVYENEARGVTKLGKLVDRGYLDSIGWKGIRQRKINSIATIKETIEALLAAGETVRILDIAGGPARYLIETAAEYPQIEVRVRDYQEQNVSQGRKVAAELGVTNITYEQMDAFDPASYEAAGYRPNIVVISGVFELFGDNELIGNAIDGVTSIIADGGYLVYTGQPWHPQLEQIAHVLGNHQQQRWVMRRRSQYELDRLFENAGFKKRGMKIDDWGIFTVSVARFSRDR